MCQTLTVTEYVTITIDRLIISGEGGAASTVLSTSAPAATSQASSNPGNTYYADSPDTPDSPDSPDLGSDANNDPSNTDFDVEVSFFRCRMRFLPSWPI